MSKRIGQNRDFD